MARTYQMQTWVGERYPDTPEQDDYSGEQIGNRKKASVNVTPGYDENGNADLGFYSDPNETFKTNPVLSIDPAFKVLASYQEDLQKLTDAYDKNIITKTVYDLAVLALNVKQDKAQRKLNKLHNHVFIEDESLPEQTEECTTVLYPEDSVSSEELSLSNQIDAIYRYENEII